MATLICIACGKVWNVRSGDLQKYRNCPACKGPLAPIAGAQRPPTTQPKAEAEITQGGWSPIWTGGVIAIALVIVGVMTIAAIIASSKGIQRSDPTAEVPPHSPGFKREPAPPATVVAAPPVLKPTTVPQTTTALPAVTEIHAKPVTHADVVAPFPFSFEDLDLIMGRPIDNLGGWRRYESKGSVYIAAQFSDGKMMLQVGGEPEGMLFLAGLISSRLFTNTEKDGLMNALDKSEKVHVGRFWVTKTKPPSDGWATLELQLEPYTGKRTSSIRGSAEEENVGSSHSNGNAIAGVNDADFFAVCESGTLQQVQECIKAGANVHAKTQEGTTPLLAAAAVNGNLEVIAALVKAGADVNARNNTGITPLMAAALNGNPEKIAVLAKAGANVNARNNDGTTPLMAAAMHNTNPEVSAYLVKAGADVNAKDEDGGTPLISAAMENPNPEVITALVKAGADINAKFAGGVTPLMLTSLMNKNPEVINALVKAGADVNAKNKVGTIPLMEAAMGNKNPEVIATLIKVGADINAKDDEGKTALDLARKYKRSEAVTALIKAGAK